MIQTPGDIKTYRKELRVALKNRFLRRTLDNFATAYRESRAKAFEGIELEALIEEIARSRDAAIPRLEELYESFKVHAEAAGAVIHTARTGAEANAIIAAVARENGVRKIVKSKSMTAEETFLNDHKVHAEAAGAVIHTARTGAEANAIIAAVARENGVRKIVKSKSMTAEETFLNDHLEREGFHVTETDLGEWIIQLRSEGPSHMVMPAIHLSRYEVAELFRRVTGEALDPDDIEGMVKVARRELRRAYLEADMGISGANFALADSGTLGIITNEGNARLVTTLPRVHVALVGFEKLVPDLASALRILKVLPRNATGQIISTYVTWITGAVECGSSPTGKKILHVVFLDNGRLKLAGDPVFSEALRCVRCGACANVCPIYRLVGGHHYGHVYIGAIGLILTYFYHGVENARAIVQNCLNCQACKSVCPAGINLPLLIKNVYRAVLDEEGSRPVKNRLLAAVLKDRRLFHFLLRRAAMAQKPLAGGRPLIRHLPLLFTREHRFRSLPVIQAAPLRDRWRTLAKEVPAPAFKVALFAGCLVDFVYPEQAETILPMLAEHGVSVDFPSGQSCCGLPALMAAERETARRVAMQNIEAFEGRNYDYVLTLCASCASHLKENYPKLLADDPAWAGRTRSFTLRVIDFSSFVMNVLKVSPQEFAAGGKKVAYHAPCHLCRGLKVTEEPRNLLRTAGLEYVPAKDEDVCCGFGGSYSIQFPELSAELLKRKLDNVEETEAELLVTDCPGCVLQLRGGMDKRGGRVRVKHIAEAVAEERSKKP